ncbi:MAG: hypothetical protein ACJAQT_001426 [Akkermansiaceae bacterium]|jgi:hypothetical protein
MRNEKLVMCRLARRYERLRPGGIISISAVSEKGRARELLSMVGKVWLRRMEKSSQG